jgi:hypothetical protein
MTVLLQAGIWNPCAICSCLRGAENTKEGIFLIHHNRNVSSTAVELASKFSRPLDESITAVLLSKGQLHPRPLEGAWGNVTG